MEIILQLCNNESPPPPLQKNTFLPDWAMLLCLQSYAIEPTELCSYASRSTRSCPRSSAFMPTELCSWACGAMLLRGRRNAVDATLKILKNEIKNFGFLFAFHSLISNFAL